MESGAEELAGCGEIVEGDSVQKAIPVGLPFLDGFLEARS